MIEQKDLEEIIDFIEIFMETESEHLYEISEDYFKAQSTGIMGSRKISPQMAAEFSYEFEVRSDAVEIIKDSLIKALNKNFYNSQNNA